MATSNNTINSSFTGKAASGYVSAALLSGKTLASGAIDIRDNIQYKEVIQVINSDNNLIKPGTCDFTSSGTLTTKEVVLEPVDVQVNLELCSKNFLSRWESLQMSGVKSGLPKTFGEYILERVVEKTAADVESAIWTGTTAGNIPFDGFEVLAAADASVIDVAKVAITAVNVTTELNRVVSAIPQTVYGDESLSIMVSTSIYQSYISSLGGFGATGASNATEGIDGKRQMWYNGSQPLFFLGIPVVHCPGLTATDMFAARKEDLVFGSSLYNELNQASILDMSTIDGSLNSRVILRGSAAVAIVQPEQVVFYS
tara:strand:- start:10 stop:948 length:939 start_codon:yes stop_codon:yes gene_type:complete